MDGGNKCTKGIRTSSEVREEKDMEEFTLDSSSSEFEYLTPQYHAGNSYSGDKFDIYNRKNRE